MEVGHTDVVNRRGSLAAGESAGAAPFFEPWMRQILKRIPHRPHLSTGNKLLSFIFSE